MKKLVLLLALLFSVVGVYANDSMHIRTKNGDVVSFKYADKPEIKFNGTKMTITTAAGDDPVVIELNDIDGVDMAKPAGISGAMTDNVMTIMTDGSGVHFTGIPQGANVLVAAIDGRVVVNTVVDNGEFHLASGDFAKGVYIIRINQFTTKVIF